MYNDKSSGLSICQWTQNRLFERIDPNTKTDKIVKEETENQRKRQRKSHTKKQRPREKYRQRKMALRGGGKHRENSPSHLAP